MKPQLHGRVAFLPFVRVALKASRHKALPLPETLGEHLKCVRSSRGLSQKVAAVFLGVSAATVLNWEKGETEPPITSMPRIISFLGYDPFPEPKTLTERMRATRRAQGWTMAAAAKQLGVDEGTWGQWERTGAIAWPQYRERVEGFITRSLPPRVS